MKLNVKQALLKLFKRTTFSVISANSASTSFPANTGTWVTITPTLAANQKVIATTGWYLNGIANTYLYSLSWNESQGYANAAVYNGTSSAKTGIVTVFFLIAEG